MATKPDPNSWPTDADGNPLVLVNARVKETIPTAKYANVEIDLSLIGFAESFSDSDNVEDALAAAYDKADEVLNAKRDPILEELEKGNK